MDEDQQAGARRGDGATAAAGGSMLAIGAPFLAMGVIFVATGRLALGLPFLVMGVIFTAMSAGWLAAYLRRSGAARPGDDTPGLGDDAPGTSR